MRTLESILDARVARTKKIAGERLGHQFLLDNLDLSKKNIWGK
jgi:hypothetical protein